MRPQRPRPPKAVILAVAAAVLATIALLTLGMWARAEAGPLWPAIITDWSMGSALLGLSSVVVGGVIASRLPRNVVAWLFVAQGVLTGAVFFLRSVTTVALTSPSGTTVSIWGAWGFAWVIPLNMTCLALLALLFPFGRAPSSRWRPVIAAVALIGVANALLTMISSYVPDMTPFSALPNPVLLLESSAAVAVTSEFLLLGLVAGGVAVIRRLRSAGRAERQQVKWFAFAAVVAFTTLVAGYWVEPLFVFSTLVALPAVPIAAAVAVLRYRLYDIDRVINRSAVYAAVTGVLAIAYLAAVTALRALTSPVTGDTAVAVAASTLAVAAMFRPVRNRIQQAVDRRFNRARYDAAATVEQLRLRFRDELDLESLKLELVDVVYATMEPAGTTLWLRETKR